MKGEIALLLLLAAITSAKSILKSSEEVSVTVDTQPIDYKEQLFPHHNCNQFYLCAEGIKEVLSCPDNLLYNAETKECDWPNRVECGDRIVPGGSGDITTDNDSQEQNTPEVSVVENIDDNEFEIVDIIIEIIESSGKCKDNTHFVSHKNCNQFYVCDNGIPVAFSCPEPLFFSLETESCEWPNSVDCGDRIIPEKPETEVTISPSVTALPLDTASPIVTAVPLGTASPIVTESTTLKPEWGGVSTASPVISKPTEDSDSIVSTVLPIVTPKPDDTIIIATLTPAIPAPTTEGSVTSLPLDPAFPNIIDPPDSVDSEEDQNNDGECRYNGQLLPDEKCNKFKQCSHGVPIIMSCPKGTLYDPKNKFCDWSYKVDCGDRIISEGSDEETAPDVSTPEEYESESDEETAPKPDSNGVSTASSEFTKPTEDSESIVSTASPSVPTPAPEKPEVEIATPIESSQESEEQGTNNYGFCNFRAFEDHAFPHEHCNQYYLCAHGTATAMFCPSQLLYNPTIRRCDWPENVECGDRTISVVNAW